MSHAIFVHRKMVEGVNGVIRSKGQKKVDILTAIKDFKKGIYQLEWEHKRCGHQGFILPGVHVTWYIAGLL